MISSTVSRTVSLLLLFTSSAHAALPASPEDPAGASSALETVLSEEFIAQIRDPFSLPFLGSGPSGGKRPELTLFPINDLKLNGVITGPKKLRAMISAPNGKTFFVKIGDLIGLRGGKITQIQGDSITVVETEESKGKRTVGTVELRIGGELVTISSKGGN